MTKEPAYLFKRRIFDDLSTKKDLREKRFGNITNKMTLITAIKSHDGIVIQSDTLFKDGYEYAEQGSKLFTILSKENASVVLGLAGRRDLFNDLTSIFKKKFSDATINGGISESYFVETIRRCRNEMIRRHNIDLEQMGLKPNEEWKTELAGIVGGCVLVNDEPKFVLYKFDLSEIPYPVEDYHAIGYADNEAHLLLGKIFPTFFKRFGIKWTALSKELVAQLCMFVMKFVSRNSASIDKNINALLLTTEKCDPYYLEDFFPESVKDPIEKRDYLQEMMATLLSELPGDFISRLTKNPNKD